MLYFSKIWEMQYTSENGERLAAFAYLSPHPNRSDAERVLGLLLQAFQVVRVLRRFHFPRLVVVLVTYLVLYRSLKKYVKVCKLE